MKKVWVGEDQFSELRKRDCLYVDKTCFIREVLSHPSTAVLLPRPRRFGKTLNMTMLHSFFDITQDSRALFEGLAITQDADAMTHLNAYPTLFLSLKRLGQSTTWVAACQLLRRMIAALYRTARPLLAHLTLDSEEQAYYDLIFDPHYDGHPLLDSLVQLTEWLYRATGKSTILLIDEYDAPIHAGLEKGYYEEVVGFMRGFLGEALKGNPYLERAVLTGILRIAKESIFSGLNNLKVHTVLDTPFSTCFGFTDAEVRDLLEQTQSPHPMSEVRDWYNGYRFGETIIYNPWSILNMLQAENKGLTDYWVNTSGNELIRNLIQTGEACTLAELEQLLSGKAVRKPIDSLVTIRDRKPSSAWSLLLMSGYLTAAAYDPTTKEADLILPNREVRQFYDETVRDWLGLSGRAGGLVGHLLKGELDAFAKGLAEVVVTTLSYHDTAAPDPEQVFHVFVVGMLVQLSKDYQIVSNRESGHGRPDLQLIPKKPGQPGFLFEFKAASSNTPRSLQTAAKAALRQASAQDYAASFRQANVTSLTVIGLASHGKHLALASTVQSQPDGPTSEVICHLAGPQPEPKPKPSTTASKDQRAKAPSTASQPTNLELERQKAMLVGQVQLLERLKGGPATPEADLFGYEPAFLAGMIKALGG